MSKAKPNVLITGSAGFVGGYLTEFLQNKGFEVFGTRMAHEKESPNTFILDVNNIPNFEEVLNKSKPEMIFHLAGFSSVGQSLEQAELCMKVNYEGTKNLLDSCRKICPQAKVLIIGSSEVYGKPEFLPITEDHPLKGENPYAVSRIKQGTLLEDYKDLQTYWTRSFNHTGPGQRLGFVVPDFTSQIAKVKLEGKENKIMVGNLEVARDFSDVRDIVRGYFEILDKGEPHTFYNICSGYAIELKDLMDKLIKISGVDIEVVVDPAKYRPNDVLKYFGSYEKLNKKTGWKPEISIDQTLKDTFDYWIKTLQIN